MDRVHAVAMKAHIFIFYFFVKGPGSASVLNRQRPEVLEALQVVRGAPAASISEEEVHVHVLM